MDQVECLSVVSYGKRVIRGYRGHNGKLVFRLRSNVGLHVHNTKTTVKLSTLDDETQKRDLGVEENGLDV